MGARQMAGSAATLWDLLAWRAQVTPERPMYLDDLDQAVTYGEFLLRCERLAAGFGRLGITLDTHVTWQMPTRFDSILVMMALARIGACQNPVIPLYREKEVRSVVAQTTPEWLIVPRRWRDFDHEGLANRLAGEVTGLSVLVVDDGLPYGDPSTLPPPPPVSTTARWIYTTSGTTAEPKCVLHTDTSLLAAGRAMTTALQLGSDDVGCLPVPIAHPGGFSYLVAMFTHGFPTVLVDPWSIDRAVGLMNRFGTTVMGGSTAHFIMLLGEQRKDPSTPLIDSVRMFTGGGAALPAELFRQIVDGLGVRPAYGYGMTECPTIAMGSPSDTDEQLANTPGRISDGLDVRVVDSQQQLLDVGLEGEIEIRGPMVCLGYTDAELTAAAFTDDGWMRTGDRGYIRPDRHVVLTGRTKEIIIRKGENISPAEIESVMLKVPGVAAVSVIGLPDRDRGEMVCAVVELVADAVPPTLIEVRRVCEHEGLMIQKVPERLEIVDHLPRSATMKVLKHELRDRFAPH
ncbi:MAG: class I adenylate-forming enzyme family protein [Acidimicrobiia bacterium]